jgi:hypothetical protein
MKAVLFGAGLGLILVLGLIYLFPKILFDRRPADFRIDGPSLVITNKAGRELWRFGPGRENLKEADFYRERFQFKRTKTGPEGVPVRVLPLLLARDFNRDGKNEVLFSPQFPDEKDSGRVILFDRRGRKIWELEAGKEVLLGPTLVRDFVCSGFDTIDLDEDGRLEILVISRAREHSPTRILILSWTKVILGEYWNVGRIADFAFADFDRDFKPELLLAGQNDEYGQPCFILLEPERMAGSSPQGEDFRFADTPPGQEIVYLLLPLSPLESLRGPRVGVTRFDILRAERIRASVGREENIFELDFNLQPLTVELSRAFERRYAEAVRAGLIRESFDPDGIRRRLLAGFRAFDRASGEWSDRWTMSAPRSVQK